MVNNVLRFEEIDQTQVEVVGGKGAHLGELSRIEGIQVPDGFCVTTDAFRRLMAVAPSIEGLLDDLACLKPEDRAAIGTRSAEIRQTLEGIAIPDDLAAAITGSLARLGAAAYAVRSSATAEDLPTASFAGQHDSYLNVVGPTAILQHISGCWASLFTERAVTYRLRNGIDHRTVAMAVVVQRMVAPHASGVLFTADPVTGNRKVTSIEAVLGLGEALVSGLVNADAYEVRDGEVTVETLATEQSALTDSQIVRLEQLGRRIEAHFGRPQDIEWCLADDGFQIVQSRPITTLFPVPDANDEDKHVYVSVGHQQMMTDPIKALGLSVWKLTALRPMYDAGGRLFVDVMDGLATEAGRAGLLAGLGRSDPLLGDTLATIIEHEDVVPSLSEEGSGGPPAGSGPFGGPPSPIETDPGIITELIGRTEDSLATLEHDIRTKSGSALFDFILEDIAELQRLNADPQSMQVLMAGIEATWWLNDHLQEWLGEKHAADTLTQSVPHNVTSEMGLALLDVADAVRPHPDVVAYLRDVENEDFLDDLAEVAGGPEARDAIRGYLDEYGMRCVGEIDITRPRWSERPTILVPVILGHVENAEAGASQERFERGRQEAQAKEQEVLERLRALPDGAQKAEETKRMIDRVRTFAGYREFPKYGMVRRYFVYKQALMEEAERLVQSDVIGDVEDIFHLTFDELHDVVRTGRADDELIRRRKEAFVSYQALTPPRLLTSDGEVVAGSYRRDDVPTGALAGIPVSTGTIEGRAHVILDMAEAEVDAGDILVTAHTDPSWSPLFVAIAGLVTEVGGLMTHGAVIAREYGLPAVVGVEHATELIRDGQTIRVHGTEGYVEILSE